MFWVICLVISKKLRGSLGKNAARSIVNTRIVYYVSEIINTVGSRRLTDLSRSVYLLSVRMHTFCSSGIIPFIYSNILAVSGYKDVGLT